MIESPNRLGFACVTPMVDAIHRTRLSEPSQTIALSSVFKLGRSKQKPCETDVKSSFIIVLVDDGKTHLETECKEYA